MKSKTTLPHQTDDLFLTDGGIETSLIYLDGFELPYFSAFHLLNDEKGYAGLTNYYRRYLAIAGKYKTGFILESPTWRASPDWIKKLGYPETALSGINEKAIQLMVDLKKEFEKDVPQIVISGCVGPRGDGYKPQHKMNVNEAQRYHAAQISVFSRMPVDVVTAVTMNYTEEALGIVRAANAVNRPVVISFTVETNGRLPDGTTLKEAIAKADRETESPPLYYMINCAHPTHFFPPLKEGQHEEWTKRIRGIRANASCKSHAELDEATALDRGNPEEFGKEHGALKSLFKHLNVFGGCCGTDDEHVLQILKQTAKAGVA